MPLELKAFDLFLTQARSHNLSPDQDIRIIKITNDDIKEHIEQQKQEPGERTFLPDRQFKTLLEQLNQAENRPRVIGLDMYYSRPVVAAFDWRETLKQTNQLIGICQRPQLNEDKIIKNESIDPPPSTLVPPERVGFSDFLTDASNVVRRQFLTAPVPTSSPSGSCVAQDAFSVLIAREFLKSKGYQYVRPHLQQDSQLFGNITFPLIKSWWGGYQGIRTGEYQTMLKYRAVSGSPENVAESYSLGEFLSGEVPKGWTKDKIVLIGLTGEYAERRDIAMTPYGELPGVIVHAHMVSQILRAVLDQEPLLSVWPQWTEALWIVGWCLLGGMLACCFRSARILLFVGGIATLLLLLICAVSLRERSVWLPSVPAGLGLWGAGVIVYSKRCFSNTPLQSPMLASR